MAAEMADHHGTAFWFWDRPIRIFARFVQYPLFLPIVFDALSETEKTLGEAR